MAHAFVTVVVPFDDSRSVAVNAHLDALGNLARPPLSETLNASAFVHFMSLTVVRASSGGSANLERLRAHLFGEAVYKWAFVAEPMPLLADAPKGWSFVGPVVWSALRTFLWPLFVLPALVLLVLVWQGLWAATLALGAELVLAGIAPVIAYAWFRHKERMDVPDDRDPSAQVVGEIMERENKCAQNHLAAVFTMKSGWLRRLTL